jgi:hypothetical protein
VNWLDTLLDRSREAKVAASVNAGTREAGRAGIRSWWIQTAAPRPPNFAGAIEPLFYFVDDGAVTLCDETGKKRKKRCGWGRALPRRIAAMLKRASLPLSDFNRAIHYGLSDA